MENEVSLTGMLCEEPQLDYTVDGLAYLEAVIEVKRGSGIGSDRSAFTCADVSAWVTSQTGKFNPEPSLSAQS